MAKRLSTGECGTLEMNKRSNDFGDINYFLFIYKVINWLNTEVNPICNLLALLGAHHILHVSRIRVKRQVKTHLPSTDIITSSPYSPH